MHEPVYEMVWDCAYCGQPKNLGLTHRHCPSCGAPQQPERRYFPPEDQKVAVQNHQFVGTDKACPSCGVPSSARANNCGNCGSPFDGAREVARMADAKVAPAMGAPAFGAPPAKPQKKSRLWLVALVGLLALGCAVTALLFIFWKEEKSITVTQHSWRRSIAIERFQTESGADWCDSLPSGARVTARAQRQRGTRRIQDGQTCTTRNVDNGDGTFRQVQDCQPRYREEPAYADHCSYTADRWVRVNEAVSAGSGTSPAPSWPSAQVTGCAGLGCTREGARVETYTLHLDVSGSGPETCTVSQARWGQVQDRSRWKASVGVLSGSVDCDEMTPN